MPSEPTTTRGSMIARAIAKSRLIAAECPAAAPVENPLKTFKKTTSNTPAAHHRRGSSIDSIRSTKSMSTVATDDSKVSKYAEFLRGRQCENVGSSAPFKYLLDCASESTNGDVFTSRDLRTILMQLSLFRMQLNKMVESSKAVDDRDLLVSWQAVYDMEEAAFKIETKKRLEQDQLRMREQLQAVVSAVFVFLVCLPHFNVYVNELPFPSPVV